MRKWILLCLMMFLPQAIWAADIQATLEWSRRVELSTPVSGVIKSVSVEVGGNVKKGDVLLSLDTTAFRARVAENQSEIIRMEAELSDAEKELGRVKELYERTIVSTTDLDQAKLRVVKTQSTLSGAKARLLQNQKNLEDAVLRAPFDAVVVLRQAETGQSVSVGLQPQMLLTLAKSGEMIARMHLSLSQLEKLTKGQKVELTTAGARYTGNIKTLGLEPIKINESFAYPVDVLFISKLPLRAGVPAQVTLP